MPIYIRQSDHFFADAAINLTGTTAVSRAVLTLEFEGKSGRHEFFDYTDTTWTGDRTTEAFVGGGFDGSNGLPNPMGADAILTDATLVFVLAGTPSVLKRGQAWARIGLRRYGVAHGKAIAQGYIQTTTGNQIHLGQFEEPGPGGGEGFLSWVTLALNVAGNVDTTVAFAATNAFRKIYGFVWYYNASADVAARTMQPRLKDLGFTAPTGFTGAARFWQPNTDQAVAASEEGVVVVFGGDKGPGYGVRGLAGGALSKENTASDPIPFPLLVTESEPADIELLLGSGHANDRYSAYALVEEWLVI